MGTHTTREKSRALLFFFAHKKGGCMKRSIVRIPYDRYPETAQHILDYLAVQTTIGGSIIYTVDRPNASKRRRLALRGTKALHGLDRDEFPMAMLAEGGLLADIRYIKPSDNRGAGSYISNYLRLKNIEDGDRILFLIY